MKTTTFKRAIFAIAMMLITASTSWAYDFIVDGIYYNYNGDGETVSVTYKNKDYNSYSGSVVIPSTVTYDGTTYSVTEIGDGAFETCSNLTSLTIGNSVTSIGSYAFNNCKNLISVTIPKSVNKIGDKAFYNCYGIMSFTSLNTTPPSAPSENVFKGIPRSDCTLFVPEESITSYSGSTGWSYFYNIQGIKNDHVETVEHNVVKVATADGAISISGADGAIAEIFSTSGTLLYRGSDATIKMPHGIYIVKVAEKTTKVVL